MGEYQKVLHSELNNLLDLIGGGEPPQMSVEEFCEVLNYKLSPEAKKKIKKCLGK